MRVLLRLLLGLSALLAVAALAIGGALWWSLPPSGLVASVPGLSATTRIALDADGIPRIEAATDEDAAAALGFLHARDRLFQMDLTRRAGAGRLSELAGPSTLRLDRTMRVLGLQRRAEQDWPALAPETRALIEAYARGVNAWIALRGRFAAPEFVALGEPEPWQPTDSLLWGKVIALYLSGNYRQELARAGLPEEQRRTLWPPQESTPGPAAALDTGRMLAAIPTFPEPFTWPASASNEWAVDGAHSVTGAPLLAGDPHLGLTMPAIWYLARITTPSGVLAGATAPGVPFLVLGHNGRIAWTFTTTGADTQDVFVETAVEGGYATPDGPRPFATRLETIRVRGGPDQTFTVRETRHGPVISDLDADTPDGPVLAVAMASLAPGDAADGLLALNRARTVDEAGAAAPRIVAPIQNLLVADRQGIGQFTTGRIPLRRAGDGTGPVQGADGAHDWTGFAEGDRLPHQRNPASGRLLNANERIAPPGFPVFMGQDWFGDWRARRIRELLDARTTHSVQSFAQMQVDATSAFARAVLPRLLAVSPPDEPSRKALLALRRWDGSMRADQALPLLFNDWMRRLEAALLARRSLAPGSAGQQADLVWRALQAEEGPGGCGGPCAPLLAETLLKAAAAWDPEARWGEEHKAEFAHPLLGRLPLVGRLFTWSVDQPGDDSTLFRGTPRGPGWTSVHGPGFRGVYDLADLDRSVFGMAPGQSGHMLSAHVADLMQRWRNGTTLRLGPAARVADTIELRP